MQIQVLQSVVPIKDEEVVLGQYEGYLEDPTVPDGSYTPTFATMVLRLHNERWEGTEIDSCIFLIVQFRLSLLIELGKNEESFTAWKICVPQQYRK